MGFFKSSDLPQPPLPNLAIHLYNPADKVYVPDDIVSGHIDLTPVIPITPVAIEASLWGHSRIWHRISSSNGQGSTSYSHYRDNAPLFEVSENVLANHSEYKQAMLQPGRTYTFPFSFRFPAGTANARFGQYKEDNDERWSTGPHPLPPTFKNQSKYARKEDQPDYSKIEYGVRAKLICPGVGVVQGKNMIDMGCEAPVLFQPQPPHQQMMNDQLSLIRSPKTFSYQSSALTGQEPSKIGFRQGMMDRLSSHTPKLDFEAAVEIPDLLVSGAEFRFRASFGVMTKSDSVTQIPAITFTVLKLELLEFTFCRAVYDREATTLMDGRHRHNRYEFWPPPYRQYDGHSWREIEPFEERKNPLNSIPESATIELGQAPPGYSEKDSSAFGKNPAMSGQDSKGEVWFTSRIPGFTPPSFKSFAISRVYRIKVKLGVEIGGKQFVLETESHVRHMASAA